MRIPDIQDRLIEIAHEIGNSEIERLARKLSRRSPTRKAPNSSEPMTDKKAAQIRQYAKDNPRMTQVEIGRRFGVNQGRVSEALRGFRT